MKKVVRDGWHVCKGYDVYVEDGKVLRAVKNGLTAYVYRSTGDGWASTFGSVSLDALRSGLASGYYAIK